MMRDLPKPQSVVSKMQDENEFKLFSRLVDEHRYDFTKLVYIIFPFGQKGHALEHKRPRKWQMKQWADMSTHLMNPDTRYDIYRLAISTGNGSGKTAFCAMTNIMLLYTHMLKGRLTANTKPQLTQVIWPEYDKWFKYARFSDMWFEKMGESIQSLDAVHAKQWRLDLFTWDETNPSAVSGLHNEGHAVSYTFEEAPGIPAVIFNYARGAFTDKNTIRFWLVVGNSDDPDSYFESLMNNPDWRTLRIDTRDLEEVDREFIAMVLKDCGGDEDADDFRVRVRGLPRKTAADSIINRDKVREAVLRASEFDINTINHFPAILTVDPAWQGGDHTVIWFHQGHYSKLLAAYKLRKQYNEDHKTTYDILCKYESDLKIDAVFIDQGEGTALKTYANQDYKHNWELVNFGSGPNDQPDTKQSEYANMRAQLYHEARKDFNNDLPVIEIAEDIVLDGDQDVLERMLKDFGLTKGDNHKITLKKLCMSKKEIKSKFGVSPDFSDGYVIKYYRKLTDRLPEHESAPVSGAYGGVMTRKTEAGSRAIEMPQSIPDYSYQGYNIGSMYGIRR